MLVLCSYDFVDTRTLGKTHSNSDVAKLLAENRAKYAALKDKFYYEVRVLLLMFGYWGLELIKM